ncbi:conserved hypothetical protein [Pseudarthrobacter chlorophenolicus A6]|uniref:Membrane protein ArfC n=1 Tax=Pseudarthrobacter chlorophenolicus (strain ATCC 700700 / DSM 12829 / CIP 107037 / JCM 12360 / KCTC 9906 / NCIMB 13794 / A6) TaxID=452863 RepID=B8HAT2_PSECP|nr:hypothetical protein [Pseudarthrobacter chlorophenolicus]ACL40246.1 conserved hypothetical protein [Pseudarthrobacter chlorophenolicus A6]SDQ85046.1 hypothetical protein SAMN04489738_3209 [Pseudarthrobacter chlorophenolicus]
MDVVMWIVVAVIVVGAVWWLVSRNSRAKSSGAAGPAGNTRPDAARPPSSPADRRTDGALSGGGAAASAEAAGTAGIASAAGFGRPAEPAAPSAADEPADSAAAPGEATAHPGAAHTATDRADLSRDASGTTPAGAAADGTWSSPLGAAAEAPASPADSRPESPRDERSRQDQAEWETQWSEAGGSGTPETTPLVAPAPEQAPAPAAQPVHHAEYTEPHSPTLPGAETAAVEEDDAGLSAAARTGGQTSYSPGPAPATDVPVDTGAATAPDSPDSGTGSGLSDAPVAPAEDSAGSGLAAAETADRTQSSALAENGADHLQAPPSAPAQGAPEPQGHLAAEEPYGAGSAGAGADGSGPAEYTVKGDAGSMVYYEEGHPDYDGTRAEVWFESAAHAEAAGFRAPRRRRL